MPASLKTIIGWLVDAKTADANFLIIARETDDEDELFNSSANNEEDPGADYPVRVWAKTSDDVHQKIHQAMIAGDKIREVYDLRADLKAQLFVERAYFVPRGKPSDGPLPEPLSVDELISGKRATTQNTGVSARATVKPRTQKVAAYDPESAKSDLERALEQGAGSLAGRFSRAVGDDE